MNLAGVEAAALQALQDAGVRDVDVYVAEHRGAVQVLLSSIVSPEIAQKVHAALRAAYPATVFDFVSP